MKKSVWIALGFIIVLVIIVSVTLGMMHKDSLGKDSKDSTSQDSGTKFVQVKACDVLTPAIAQQVAGADASAGADTGGASTNSIAVSNCNYYSVSTKSGVSLLARSALDQTGTKSNKAQFTKLPGGGIQVSGYGDAAYWDPNYGQLNILKGNNWYILQVGGVSPAERTQAQAEAYAKLISDKL